MTQNIITTYYESHLSAHSVHINRFLAVVALGPDGLLASTNQP